MRTIRLLFSVFISIWVLFSYQNCTSSESSKVGATNPNAPADAFLQKMADDAASLSTNECSYPAGTCAEGDIDCIRNKVISYYSSLECSGFTVVEENNCYVAIENTNPVAMEEVHVEATCFQEDNQIVDSAIGKRLYLGLCHAEYVGYDPNHPSTDVNISAWLNLGNEYPYSRATKTITFYPEQIGDFMDMRLAINNPDGEAFIDSCNKDNVVDWLASIFQVQVSN